jgi:hypothetical protein
VFLIVLMTAVPEALYRGVWLLGLIVVLRGATPAEREALLRAYGRAYPAPRAQRVSRQR